MRPRPFAWKTKAFLGTTSSAACPASALGFLDEPLECFHLASIPSSSCQHHWFSPIFRPQGGRGLVAGVTHSTG